MNLNDLNEAQQEAVQCIDAPSLVIAGAGSGKTRVLTYKIAYLLEQGFKPWNILALTFTNKAAREMKERIAKLVSPELAQSLWMGTFHSIFARILRRECSVLGFSSNFTIYDADDARSLIKTIIRELKLDDKTYKPSTIAARISDAKNRLIFPDAYRSSHDIKEADFKARIPATADIYLRYMQRCRLADAMDFDDLLLYTFYLLDRNTHIRLKYEQLFHFVLVDEYQDTNYAQHRIVHLLTAQRQRVCVVGDDAQSIYSFRGANVDNILHFNKTYQEAKLFKLERNYRSTQCIVNAANSLIAHNRNQIRKNVYSKQNKGCPIRLYKLQSDFEESAVVANRIALLHQRQHYAYNDIAILYRTNSQSRSLEEALRRLAIPCRIYGGLSFYQRKEIKDAVAYLRLSINPRDEEALKRIINYPTRGIGDTTVGRILASASQHGVSPWQVVADPTPYGLALNKGALDKLQRFAQLISSFHQVALTENALIAAKRIVMESGLSADINRGHEPDDIARQENLQELLDAIAAFVQDRQEQGEPALLANYLQEIALLSDLDEEHSEKEHSGSEQRVTLMTIHSAKGLEFPIVFVVGLEEELFPSQKAGEEGPRALEEERRLMYVAMTRAGEQLYLSCASSRFRFGKTNYAAPSRFIREIDPQYIQGSEQTANTSSAHSIPSWGSRHSASAAQGAKSYNHEASSFATTSPSATTSSTTAPRHLRRVSSLSKTDTAYPQAAQTTSTRTPQNTPISPLPSPQQQMPPPTTQLHPTSPQLSVGARIEHPRFGKGSISHIEGAGLDTKATVLFDNVGTKQLLLRFAKIKVIEN
ncbi:MAG: UvrD-helicase domain-containing protein [Bacteroidales bacterium]|nr:UvrD-helicase domain-containing protein [Candidatus Physcousia equi]